MTDTVNDSFANQNGSMVGPYVMSWTSHVSPTVVTLIFVAIGAAICGLSILVGALWIAFFLALYAYGFLMRLSLKLFADEDGVWVFQGILPWSKGTSGVKWRDLDEAVYFPNFTGWLFKSYRMRIGHRFTKSSEILLAHIHHGHSAVQEINQLHIHMVRQGEIDDVQRA